MIYCPVIHHITASFSHVVGTNSSVCVTNNGHIVHEEPALEIKNQPEVLQRYLGV